ncbi:hypothetical protein SKAU_G00331320 [Synaphobranchus kaupii]|uniref:Uncharacterized protein n=1 Tax=Synaphobranchus kaupii TaxID=118154 RepID=A0A9Q1EL35_SYNKA|nr:hypothetical protein SKAU_G00331320 [Synaphobranchus kaupii]
MAAQDPAATNLILLSRKAGETQETSLGDILGECLDSGQKGHRLVFDWGTSTDVRGRPPAAEPTCMSEELLQPRAITPATGLLRPCYGPATGLLRACYLRGIPPRLVFALSQGSF